MWVKVNFLWDKWSKLGEKWCALGIMRYQRGTRAVLQKNLKGIVYFTVHVDLLQTSIFLLLTQLPVKFGLKNSAEINVCFFLFPFLYKFLCFDLAL